VLRLRQFAKLEYGDPRGFLIHLRKFEIELSASDTPKSLRNLRTNGLKGEREMRDAALFCVGISECIGSDVRFAPFENQDFDFIATWPSSDIEPVQNFCPIQLKEVAPPHLNPNSSVQGILNNLRKYKNSKDLAVAIKLNRPDRFDPSEVLVPSDLQVGSIWIFGSISEDQSEWAIWGDFANDVAEPVSCRYLYPT
jgi:hypothetical protein